MRSFKFCHPERAQCYKVKGNKNKVWKISDSSISDVKDYGNDMNGLKKVADQYGYVSKFREKMSINDIEKYLSNGIPVIINILQPQKTCATHAVLVVGYDRNKKILFINVSFRFISYKFREKFAIFPYLAQLDYL